MADCSREYEYRLDKLDEKMKEVEKALIEHGKRIEKIDEANKSAHKRLNEIGEQTLAIYKLSMAVENIAEQFKEFAMNFKEHEERLDTLEKAPGKQAYDLQRQIIVTIVLAIVGFALGKWGIK